MDSEALTLIIVSLYAPDHDRSLLSFADTSVTAALRALYPTFGASKSLTRFRFNLFISILLFPFCLLLYLRKPEEQFGYHEGELPDIELLLLRHRLSGLQDRGDILSKTE